ncbi:MAG: HipA domain-containing protein [Ignavibacteriaceae bacterium]|nr:HipA domain-containing protein [Ignavibacteriaceae bacterium]
MTGENRCHSCLKECVDSFCRSCRRLLFNGRMVSHILPFSRNGFMEAKLQSGSRISISGVQIKHLLRLQKNRFELTASGGEYILKPAGSGSFLFPELLAANEHLTMQAASQVFDLKTAPNAFMLLSDGSPAYIIKRFDRTSTGTPLPVEDFAQIAGKSSETGGPDFKYNSSYEEIGNLIRKYVSAPELELEKFFRLVFFNYLISNGDAHLKNFSLLRNDEFGDYLLSPAYDLLCTRLHLPNESDTALDLFADGYESEGYKAGSKYLREDFEELGRRLGLHEDSVQTIINDYIHKSEDLKDLTEKSFLSVELKKQYILLYNEKVRRFM